MEAVYVGFRKHFLVKSEPFTIIEAVGKEKVLQDVEKRLQDGRVIFIALTKLHDRVTSKQAADDSPRGAETGNDIDITVHLSGSTLHLRVGKPTGRSGG
jgi:hypothetical protein